MRIVVEKYRDYHAESTFVVLGLFFTSNTWGGDAGVVILGCVIALNWGD